MRQIEVVRTRTCKGYSPKDSWRQYDCDRLTFADMSECREWLKGEYGTAKRSLMYRDGEDGKAIRAGWVIGFRSPACCPGDNPKLNQDWLSVYAVERVPALHQSA